MKFGIFVVFFSWINGIKLYSFVIRYMVDTDRIKHKIPRKLINIRDAVLLKKQKQKKRSVCYLTIVECFIQSYTENSPVVNHKIY